MLLRVSKVVAGVSLLGISNSAQCYCAPASQATSTIYPSKCFEVRDHDAPVKYVFNGNTRVVRVTGSLNATNTRVQRLRLVVGWNLCSLAVTAQNALTQLSTLNSQPVVSAGYQWNPAISAWDTVTTNQTLNAGTVLWVKAASNATLRVTGVYPGPSPSMRASPEGAFLPGAGLEVWNFELSSSNLPALTTWHFDSAISEWKSTRPAPPVELTNFPSVLGPGAAFYVQAPVPADLELPDPALSLRYYHQDHLGSSGCLTDAQGNLIEETANYPFGRPRHEYRPKGLQDPYKFTQKEGDAESGLLYVERRFLNLTLARWLSPDPLALFDPSLALKRPPQVMHLHSYCQGNPLKYADPSGLDCVIVIVGTDDPSGDHTHQSSDSFVRRVDTLLNTPTKEGVNQGLTSDDQIYVVIPKSMNSELVRQLQSYGEGLVNFEVVQTDAQGVVDLVNSRNDIKSLTFFGHGAEKAPIFEYSKAWLPEPSKFNATAFKPDAEAIFATCNSRDYAKKFTESLGVRSTGVEGTSFYGVREISAGRMTKNSAPGTSRAWTFTKNGELMESSERSLNQTTGTPFLRRE